MSVVHAGVSADISQRGCSSGSHFLILREFERTSRELPLNPKGTELGAKSENGARHECTPLMARQEQFECR